MENCRYYNFTKSNCTIDFKRSSNVLTFERYNVKIKCLSDDFFTFCSDSTTSNIKILYMEVHKDALLYFNF